MAPANASATRVLMALNTRPPLGGTEKYKPANAAATRAGTTTYIQFPGHPRASILSPIGIAWVTFRVENARPGTTNVPINSTIDMYTSSARGPPGYGSTAGGCDLM